MLTLQVGSGHARVIAGVVLSSLCSASSCSLPLPPRRSCCSLWVGNVTVELTKDDLWDLFQTFGEIKSIRVMHERFCAFVNFENASMAASALEMLKGVEIRGTRLVMRYPENWTQHTPLATKRQSQSVDETP